MIVKDN